MKLPPDMAMRFAAVVSEAHIIPGRKEPDFYNGLEARFLDFLSAFHSGVRTGLARPLCSRVDREVFESALTIMEGRLRRSTSVEQLYDDVVAQTLSIRQAKSSILQAVIDVGMTLNRGQPGDELYRACIVSLLRLSSSPRAPKGLFERGMSSPIMAVGAAMLSQGAAILEYLRSQHNVEGQAAVDIFADLFVNAAVVLAHSVQGSSAVTESALLDTCKKMMRAFNRVHGAGVSSDVAIPYVSAALPASLASNAFSENEGRSESLAASVDETPIPGNGSWFAPGTPGRNAGFNESDGSTKRFISFGRFKKKQ